MTDRVVVPVHIIDICAVHLQLSRSSNRTEAVNAALAALEARMVTWAMNLTDVPTTPAS